MGRVDHNNPDLTLQNVSKILYNQFPHYSFSPVTRKSESFLIAKEGNSQVVTVMAFIGKKERYIDVSQGPKPGIYANGLHILFAFIFGWIFDFFRNKKDNTVSLGREILEFLHQLDLNSIEIPEKYNY